MEKRPPTGRKRSQQVLASELTRPSNKNEEPLKTERIALYIEEVSVGRREVSAGGVQVVIQTKPREQLVDEAVTSEKIEILRLPINRPVDAAPPVREEGDATIISVVEETIVIERRLILKEEIHLRRARTTERHTETVTLRAQEAVIKRTGPDGAVSATSPDPPQFFQPK
jgi:stress response protein YsnF